MTDPTREEFQAHLSGITSLIAAQDKAMADRIESLKTDVLLPLATHVGQLETRLQAAEQGITRIKSVWSTAVIAAGLLLDTAKSYLFSGKP